MKIRVLRLIEITYDSVETMESDMGRWLLAANGTRRYGDKVYRSVTLPLEVLTPEVVVHD